MNKKNARKLRVTTLIVTTIISVLIIYIHISSHNKAQEIYIKQTEKIIMDMKKTFLEDTVNNIITEIDKLRKSKLQSYNKNTDYRLSRIEEELGLSDKDFISYFSDKFESEAKSGLWTALLWDDDTGEILYASKELEGETVDVARKSLQSLVGYSPVIEKNNIRGKFGVKTSYIDETVKQEVADSIRNREFSNDSYIWVNEVVNYEGGKNYAIRKVHPNLTQDEGKYLSTDMKDPKGNLPYLEELEGINKDGELFFTYYFEKLNSSEMSEKITFAKLYKDYDWIIAMGVHLDEIDAYIDKINDETIYSSTEYTMSLLRYIFIILIIGFTILYMLEKRNLLNSTKHLEDEINQDILTKAFSRRSGERSLEYFFNKYKKKEKNSAIMMFDVDDFKSVNDNYGHDVGDLALIEVIETINKLIRDSDYLIRWGGDEFIGIFPELKEASASNLGERILEKVNSIRIPVEEGTIGISISIGFTYFKEDDSDADDVIKRVDQAMYKAKRQGKNKVII